MGVIETLAWILIVLAGVKMVVLLIKPGAWMDFAKSVWAKPKPIQWIALVLAVVVFYYLTAAGISVVEILAVSVLIMLLLVIGLSEEVPYFINKYDELVKKGKLWKQYWLYTLIWVVLLILGLKELLAM